MNFAIGWRLAGIVGLNSFQRQLQLQSKARLSSAQIDRPPRGCHGQTEPRQAERVAIAGDAGGDSDDGRSHHRLGR